MTRRPKSLMDEYKPTPNTLAWRVANLVDASGLTATAISTEAGSKDLIRDIFRRPHQSLTLSTIEKLAKALNTTPEWLAFGLPPEERGKDRQISLLGDVAAGIWREVDIAQDIMRTAPILVPPDPRYHPKDQFDLLVRGSSINRLAREGDYLRCVSLKKTGISAQSGDLVVVERRRAQEGQIETTAKRLRKKEQIIELWPESDDPRWNAPFVIDKKNQSETENINIIARVLFVFREISYGH